MTAEIEQRDLSRTVVLSTAVPEYDHVPLVSVVENTRFWDEYDCSPGIGVFLVPAIDVETDSDVSPSTRAPEMFGVTVNEYVAPGVKPDNGRLRTSISTE